MSIVRTLSALKRKVLARAMGTAFFERDWKHRGVSDIESFWSNRDLPNYKRLVTEFLSDISPASILEIGANCGPNLYNLSKKFPAAEIVGTDINEAAVQAGNTFFRTAGMENVRLIVARAEELSQFRDRHFDLVFSWQVLLLIGPDKIKPVMKELVRVTRTSLVLLEPHIDDDPSEGLGIYNHYWLRNYETLVREADDTRRPDVAIRPIPKDMWSPGCGHAAVLRFTFER